MRGQGPAPQRRTLTGWQPPHFCRADFRSWEAALCTFRSRPAWTRAQPEEAAQRGAEKGRRSADGFASRVGINMAKTEEVKSVDFRGKSQSLVLVGTHPCNKHPVRAYYVPGPNWCQGRVSGRPGACDGLLRWAGQAEPGASSGSGCGRTGGQGWVLEGWAGPARRRPRRYTRCPAGSACRNQACGEPKARRVTYFPAFTREVTVCCPIRLNWQTFFFFLAYAVF